MKAGKENRGKQPPEASYKKAVRKNFAILIARKHLQKETPTQVFLCYEY